jgi:tetratricopeptide (TPR) repeat protein
LALPRLATKLLFICAASSFLLSPSGLAKPPIIRSDDPLNPTIPKGVPQSGEPFSKKKRELESNLIEKGEREGNRTKGKRRGKSKSTDTKGAPLSVLDDGKTEDKAAFSLGKIEIPNFSKLKSGAKRAGSRNLMGPASDLPQITLRPPKGIAAYLGQTLELKVDAQVAPERNESPYFVWIVNSKVVCTGKVCALPIDGESVDVGTKSLSIVAFHSGGSSLSEHILHVVQGSWKKGQPFNRKTVKRIESRSVSGIKEDSSTSGAAAEDSSNESQTAKALQFDASKDYAYSLNGGGVHAYPGHFKILGDIGQNFRWTGRMRTSTNGVLKIESKDRGEWYVLKRSTVRLLRKSSEGAREIAIEQGGVRLRTIRRSDDAGPGAIPLEDQGIETAEARIVGLDGSDFFVVRTEAVQQSPQPPADAKNSKSPTRDSTQVIVISGSVQIKLKKFIEGQPNFYNLPTGLEFTVYSDGQVEPSQKPYNESMEKLQAITITPAEVVAEVAAANAVAAQKINLDTVIKQAEEHLASEDFFEILSTLAPVMSRAGEDARLPYYVGLANKGLYQLAEAETQLKQANTIDPTYPNAPWQLALIKMDEKKWNEAQEWLDRAKQHLPSDDPRQAEYYYYSGVTEFQTGSDFAARSNFTRALWAKDLESSLQGSAGSFLKTLTERKGWGLVVPFGAQYDANVLSLLGSDPVPEGFPQRSLIRTIAGLIFSADKSSLAQESGTYWGFGAKALAITNLPRSFQPLDVIIGEVSLSQSAVTISKVPKDPNKPGGEMTDARATTKYSQSLGVVMLNSKATTATLTLGVISPSSVIGGLDLDVNVAYEASLAEKPFGSSDSVTLAQNATFPLAQFTSGQLALPLGLKQKLPFKNDATTGFGLTLSATPTYSHMVTQRLSATFGVKAEPNLVFSKPKSTTTWTVGTNAGMMYFVLPWFLVLPSLSYDAIVADGKSGVVHKPLASLLFTALL